MRCIQCQEKTSNPKFCSLSCSASYNNAKTPKRKAKSKESLVCLQCGNKLVGRQSKFCSQPCHQAYRVNSNLQRWLQGEDSGLTTIGTVNTIVKNWLRKTRNNKCEKCGWNQINPFTNKVPLVADHIDGDWRNNRPENLQLICPNCDSLQSTYKGANKGKGRPSR